MVLALTEKQETPKTVPPATILFSDFLRRHYPHQVKGSKVTPSSQPVLTPGVCKLPCILLLGLLYTPCHKVQEEKRSFCVFLEGTVATSRALLLLLKEIA